jgi:hypothetical protein
LIQEEHALAQMVDRRGHDPRALLIHAKHVAREIRTKPARRAHPGDHRLERAVLRHDAAPAAPAGLVVGVVAHVEVERDPEVAPAIALRPVGVAVIRAGDMPAAASREIFVGYAVTIGVTEARDLGALRDEQAVAVAQDAKRFVQTGGKQLVSDLRGVVAQRAVDQPHLALAHGHGELAVGGPIHAADLEREALARFPIRAARGSRHIGGEDVANLVGRIGGDDVRGKQAGDGEQFQIHFHK